MLCQIYAFFSSSFYSFYVLFAQEAIVSVQIPLSFFANCSVHILALLILLVFITWKNLSFEYLLLASFLSISSVVLISFHTLFFLLGTLKSLKGLT